MFNLIIMVVTYSTLLCNYPILAFLAIENFVCGLVFFVFFSFFSLLPVWHAVERKHLKMSSSTGNLLVPITQRFLMYDYL